MKASKSLKCLLGIASHHDQECGIKPVSVHHSKAQDRDMIIPQLAGHPAVKQAPGTWPQQENMLMWWQVRTQAGPDRDRSPQQAEGLGIQGTKVQTLVVVDALQWIMEQRGGSNLAHYIDDVITLGAPGLQECRLNQTIMHETCNETGFPYEPDIVLLIIRFTQ